MLANIIPATKTRGDNEIFSYSIPADLAEQIVIGSIVNVPFGKNLILGVVKSIEEASNTPSKYTVKNIASIASPVIIPTSYLDLAQWISDYYLCSIGEAISMFTPNIMKRPKKADEAQISISDHLPIALTDEQEKAYQSLNKSLEGKEKKPALLYGVTGSGKTEVYLKLAEDVIKSGKQVIVLVPEIILTPQTIERFEKVFGKLVTVTHHNLSKSEKYQCYMDFYTGAKPIIVGPRSALLVPSDKIGLIIVDEEQEDSYKQEQNPRYHAVQLAEELAKRCDALLLLGSATPRIEIYHRAKEGKYDLLTLENRYKKTSLPPATIVNLKNEIKLGNFSSISETLQVEIKKALDEKRQILLFLNRRGSATFVSCRDCGHVMQCKKCSIPLIYHTNERDHKLSCHHCSYEENVPEKCPSCGSLKIKFFGAGIDKVTLEARNFFPDARIVKIDSTTVKNRADYENIYQKLKKHEVDIVIGTQMIAKGLDIPGVDLVGIISADTGLHLPFYRSSEKSFQILTQVSGRSGRRENMGKTIIQTYWPDANPIICASKHDFEKYYKSEIVDRMTFGYPPFTHLVRVIADDTKEEKAKSAIKSLAKDLTEKQINFIGPGKCFYHKLNERFRYHIIIKTDALPNAGIKAIWQKHQDLFWDIDPVNML